MDPQVQNNSEQTSGVKQDPLFSLEELTVKTTDLIDGLKGEIKTAREIVKDSFARNDGFVSQSELVKAEKQQLRDITKELSNVPENATLLQKIKDLKFELKEKRQTVSEYAMQLKDTTGATEIERDGITYKIVASAKVVKK